MTTSETDWAGIWDVFAAGPVKRTARGATVARTPAGGRIAIAQQNAGLLFDEPDDIAGRWGLIPLGVDLPL